MTEANKQHNIVREARHAAREVVVDGVPWLVYELPPMPLDRRKTTSLVFESEETVRRVRNFPGHWRSLSDLALFAVSEGA